MENTRWEQKLQALTHILTHPTTTPSLHSQFFISSLIPCYLHWDYPPLLCPQTSSTTFHPPLLLKWAISLFLRRASRFGLPETSWRSKCPYQQPPPLILAHGVEEAQWGDEERRKYVRKRLSMKRKGIDVNPLIPVLVPNMLLLSFLFWNPFSADDEF